MLTQILLVATLVDTEPQAVYVALLACTCVQLLVDVEVYTHALALQSLYAAFTLYNIVLTLRAVSSLSRAVVKHWTVDLRLHLQKPRSHRSCPVSAW